MDDPQKIDRLLKMKRKKNNGNKIRIQTILKQKQKKSGKNRKTVERPSKFYQKPYCVGTLHFLFLFCLRYAKLFAYTHDT